MDKKIRKKDTKGLDYIINVYSKKVYFLVNKIIGIYWKEEFGSEVEGISANYEYLKIQVKINGKDIMEDDNQGYEDMGSDWTISIGRPCEYKEGDKIEYFIIIKDKSEKETIVDFDLRLSKATSMEEYNKNLPNDTNNNITVSAMTKEEIIIN